MAITRGTLVEPHRARPEREPAVGSAILTQLIYRLPGRQTLPHASTRAPFAVPTTQSQSRPSSQLPVALSGGVRVECAAHKIIMEGEATKNRNRNRNQNAKCTQIYCTAKKKKTLITTTTANEVKQNLRPSRRCEC